MSILFVSILTVSMSFGQNTRSVSNFDSFHASGNVSVTLIKSNETKVEFEMIRGNEESLQIKEEGSKLRIRIKNNNSIFGRSNAKAEVKVYYKELSEIKSSAGSNVSSQGTVVSNNMDISASSGSTLSLDLSANEIGIKSSSGASMNLEGEASKVVVSTSSGATISASELISKEAYIDASSGATTSIHASEEIVAHVSSGGNVRYSGNPSKKKIDKSISGGSVRSID